MGDRAGRPGRIGPAAGRARRAPGSRRHASRCPSLRSGCGPGERAVVTGWAVIVLGTIPFAQVPVRAARGGGPVQLRVGHRRGARVGRARGDGGPMAPAGGGGCGRRGGWRPVATPGWNGRCCGTGRATTPWRSSRGSLEAIPDPQGVIVIGPAAHPAAEHRGLPRSVERRRRAPDRLRPPTTCRPGCRSARSSSTPIPPASGSTSAPSPSCDPTRRRRRRAAALSACGPDVEQLHRPGQDGRARRSELASRAGVRVTPPR